MLHQSGRHRSQLLQYGLFAGLFSALGATASAFAGNLLQQQPWRRHIEPLVFVLMIGILYLLCQLLVGLKKRWREHLLPLRYSAMNSAVGGTMLLALQMDSLSPVQALGFGLASGFGFLLALLLVSEGLRRLSLIKVPKAFQGLPIQLLYVGLLSLAFCGINGFYLLTT